MIRAQAGCAAAIRSYKALASCLPYSEIYSALSRRVKVIWYEAPETTDSIELFTRPNVGRIPLTDAELVKALLLSRSRAHRVWRCGVVRGAGASRPS